MRSPLWILNSIFLILVLTIVGYIMYSWRAVTEVPPRVPLKTGAPSEPTRREGVKPKDIQFIYSEGDLFSTYQPVIIPPKPLETLPVLPPPPPNKPVVSQPKPTIQFLDPLPIKITGIIASTNEAKSQVTIVNTNTKKTESYRVGDKIFDAYVVRIFPKKVMLIRSNGQQETLYMYPADAQADIKALQESSWADVIQKQSDTSYLVNPKAFISRIGNLAQLIEMLDLTSAFRRGESIGCRVGKMDTKSIGYALGFLPGDIVTNINSIIPSTTTNRIKIYNALSELDLGAQVKVQILRKGRTITHEYTLFAVGQPTETPQASTLTADAEEVKAKYYKNLQEKYKHTADIQQLKRHEKFAMEHYGSRQAVLKRVPLTS